MHTYRELHTHNTKDITHMCTCTGSLIPRSLQTHRVYYTHCVHMYTRFVTHIICTHEHTDYHMYVEIMHAHTCMCHYTKHAKTVTHLYVHRPLHTHTHRRYYTYTQIQALSHT